MVSADWSTNGNCICPEPNRSPTVFIPDSSTSLTIARAVCPAPSASSRSASSPSLSPSTMRCSRRCSTGQPLRSSLVMVEADLHDTRVDLVEGHDARRVHDGGVEPGLAALLQVHRVEGVPSRGVEAEADVRQAEDGAHARQFGLDAADALDGGGPVAPALLDASGQGEGEGVDEQVGGFEAVTIDGEVA